ncbi:hypothetical protein BKN38_00295 [Helicobacter sp. CLO-3]|uniref:outer membrane beta-barrel protein n=1 Tax=unclassified Helicobacter TaxID=2593540 RepID=UPI0008050653|nr:MULTISPECIES: outer membrane beta-barrel protein [unclassified Helicobacter]OBV30021.1 hypothetical protein BA723_03095 [Helicobacter sp. CLO-3]OHU85878.1 hypothetical protein BKN38_00295 [Helicobacter sp. CLO-3]
MKVFDISRDSRVFKVFCALLASSALAHAAPSAQAANVATNSANTTESTSQTTKTAPTTQEKFAESGDGFLGLYASAGKITLSSPSAYGAESSVGNVLPGIGARVGYRSFFTRYVGLRYYADVEYIWQNASQTYGTNSATSTTSILISSVNMDVLLDFLHTKHASYGAFAGVGAGYQMLWSESMSVRGIHADFKLGLRAASKSVGAEIGIKAPFVNMEKKDEMYSTTEPLLIINQNIPRFYVAWDLYF